MFAYFSLSGPLNRWAVWPFSGSLRLETEQQDAGPPRPGKDERKPPALLRAVPRRHVGITASTETRCPHGARLTAGRCAGSQPLFAHLYNGGEMGPCVPSFQLSTHTARDGILVWPLISWISWRKSFNLFVPQFLLLQTGLIRTPPSRESFEEDPARPPCVSKAPSSPRWEQEACVLSQGLLLLVSCAPAL